MKSPSVFEKQVDLKLISTINHADLNRYSIPEVLQKQVPDDDVSHRRQNTFRELLRKLRYEVESSNKAIFLFTSTEPQQGKTTLIQALAYSLSLSNKRVLIIDTNFCNNDLTVALNAKPTLETFSMAPEEVSIDKVREIVTTYNIHGVEVIGCKGGDYTPSEILPRNHLLNYLPVLKEYYDFVLLEGAPLNDYTDSKELVNYVEGVIAIFSSRISLKQNDKESIQFLQNMNGKLLGAVLNNVNDDFLEL
jgi:Mrp family chromosome partitioning ATPase